MKVYCDAIIYLSNLDTRRRSGEDIPVSKDEKELRKFIKELDAKTLKSINTK